MIIEICVDSIISAKNAAESKASRIELCSALSEGGLTPSLGMFKGVKKALQNYETKIFCMIRIRRSDFIYSDEEIDAMAEDVLYFKEHGADGIVFGCLDSKSQIDVDKCQKLIAAWGHSKPMTFHRAFDETMKEDLEKNLDLLTGMGISRVLSSGYESSAERGIPNLNKMVKYTSGTSLEIVCGAGITASNVEKIITETGCKEIHTSARSEMKSLTTNKLSMGGSNSDLQALMICDSIKVKEIIKIANSV